MHKNQYTQILNLLSPALGFTAPFSIPGKLLIQQLCSENLGWNEALPEDMQINWRKWEISFISNWWIKYHWTYVLNRLTLA